MLLRHNPDNTKIPSGQYCSEGIVILKLIYICRKVIPLISSKKSLFMWL